jgi:DNA-binding CsgD family transcriptional regulator
MPEDTTSKADSDDALSDAARSFGHTAGLSSRETQILGLAVRGLADKEISARLGLAYTTIKSYWSRICFKIGVKNRQLAIGKLVADLATKACCSTGTPPYQTDRRTQRFGDDVKGTS